MAIDLSTLSAVEGDASLFVSTAGRKPSDVGESYRPFVTASWHVRGEDGKGKPMAIHGITFGDLDEVTKGLRAAGRILGCSVLVRWQPADAKRHEAVVTARNATVTDSPEWQKLGDKLNASNGTVHYRAVEQIKRPRQADTATR